MKELPFEFRLRVGNRKPDKFVGDFATKEYVTPEKYREVPLENRVFFWREEDAKRAGYTKR
ncbi:Endonuclease YhcR precursor [Mycobacterium tuberculosis]|nr:Endonuclease YhcR precursor [Mycobacterium tuberculosis]